MKNKKKIIIIVVIISIMLLSLFPIHKFTFEHDKHNIKNGNPPSYAFPFIRIKDGGSNVYYGIGYQVLRWHKSLETGERKVAYEIYEYPSYKEWEEGPETTTQYFDYNPKIYTY